MISDVLALADEPFCKMAFREDWEAEDANVYEKSDIKRYLDSWLYAVQFNQIPVSVLDSRVDAALIRKYRKIVKTFVGNKLLQINADGMGVKDKMDFERDFDEILDLAEIGLEVKKNGRI